MCRQKGAASPQPTKAPEAQLHLVSELLLVFRVGGEGSLCCLIQQPASLGNWTLASGFA